MHFLCFYFRSPAAVIVQDLQHTLLADLITGYFGNDDKLCNKPSDGRCISEESRKVYLMLANMTF